MELLYSQIKNDDCRIATDNPAENAGCTLIPHWGGQIADGTDFNEFTELTH